MHYAVANKNLNLVKLLEDNNANALIKNEDGICPIDIAISEDLRDIKLQFMGKAKYTSYDYSGNANNSSNISSWFMIFKIIELVYIINRILN